MKVIPTITTIPLMYGGFFLKKDATGSIYPTNLLNGISLNIKATADNIETVKSIIDQINTRNHGTRKRRGNV